MKFVYLSVTVEVPDDETEKHWPSIVDEIELLVEAKGYSVFDKDWGDA